MQQIQQRVRVAYVLCLAAVPAGIVAHLALTDIFHGETDLRLEWRALQVSALIIVAAVLSALRTLHGILQRGRELPTTNRAA